MLETPFPKVTRQGLDGKIEEYRRYDALGLADLVKRREASPLELLELALERAEADGVLRHVASTLSRDGVVRDTIALPEGCELRIEHQPEMLRGSADLELPAER